MKRAVVLFDEGKHPEIIGNKYPPSAGAAVARGIKSDNGIAFFQQGTDIPVKSPGGRFEAVGNQHFFGAVDPGSQRVGIRLPAMPPDGVSFQAKGKAFAGFEDIRVFPRCALVRSAEEAEGFDGRFSRADKRKDI